MNDFSFPIPSDDENLLGDALAQEDIEAFIMSVIDRINAVSGGRF